MQVRLDEVHFDTISKEDNEGLIRNITDEKIKEIVWECDSSKSPGLDGFNFGTIKFC